MPRIPWLMIFLFLMLPSSSGCAQSDPLTATVLLSTSTPSGSDSLKEFVSQGEFASPTQIPHMDRELTRTPLHEAPPSATFKVPATDQPEALICSPLGGIIPEALDEIISNPYQPSRQGKDDGHPALDFAFYNWQGLKDIQGHPVQSILKGSVVGLGFDRLPYGNMIIIETEWQDIPAAVRLAIGASSDQSLYVLYAHLLETPPAILGEEVACGQRIGSAGRTGNSGAPHLHLEARYGPGDTVFSQMVFYDTQAQEVEMDQYRDWTMSGRFRSVNPLIIFSTSSD